MAAVERWPPAPNSLEWRIKKVDATALLGSLTRTFLAIQADALVSRLAARALNGMAHEFDLAKIQAPLLYMMTPWLRHHVKRKSKPLGEWLAALEDILQTRASNPPVKPEDWRRRSTTGCSCADCQALSQFLDDPKQSTIRMPLAQRRREHLQHVIDRQKLDTTHATLRKGSPQVLVCEKTMDSYEQELKAHAVDLDLLDKIRGLLAWHHKLKG